MRHKIFYISILGFVFTAYSAYSQSSNDTSLSLTYQQAVDTFFKALDKTKTTTGILIERAPAFIQREK